VKRLKKLEHENAQLRRIVVDKELEIDALHRRHERNRTLKTR
jgi:hypothetical protein